MRAMGVSIPNGMEFYLSSGGILIFSHAVSIPNGMEFYWKLLFLPPYLGCFNSQRDGILPNFRCYKYYARWFQFPTGWNSTKFYSLKVWRKHPVSIPNGMEFYLSLLSFSLLLSRVSIPNGMEFYAFHSKNGLWRLRVSIPNGMEFYKTLSISVQVLFLRFNSQRDGILHAISIGVGIVNFSFNSQRDGILLQMDGLYLFCKNCFNSQRDGILRLPSR